MGRVVTPKYAVKFGCVVMFDGASARRVQVTDAAWNCKQSGRPTDAALRKYVLDFEASTLPGGVNEQLGMTRVGNARIVLNDGSGDVRARYQPAMFEEVRV